MTQRSPRTGIPPAIRKPPIAEELKRLRELPPRTTNREALSGLERLAILNGIRDGLSPSRIATQWSMPGRTVSNALRVGYSGLGRKFTQSFQFFRYWWFSKSLCSKISGHSIILRTSFRRRPESSVIHPSKKGGHLGSGFRRSDE